MKPLFIPLKTEYFEAFKAGTKTHELRIYGPRWNEESCTIDRRVRLRKGYSGEDVFGRIVGFEAVEPKDLNNGEYTAAVACYGTKKVESSKIARIEIKVRIPEAHPLDTQAAHKRHKEKVKRTSAILRAELKKKKDKWYDDKD